MNARKCLTGTTSYRTFGVNGDFQEMDATTKTLLRQLQELEREAWRIREKTRAIHMALNMAGVKPPISSTLLGATDSKEGEYAVRQPFADMLLSDACEQVLKDYADKWLTKSQVEWLVARGGYKSSAKDPKNSVDVTLRRLAGDGKCDVERVRGPRGNRYRWISRFPRKEEKLDSVGS